MIIKKILKSELKNIGLELDINPNGREGIDFLIGSNKIHLKSIDLDTTQRSIKITKQNLGELSDNLFIALVLIIEQAPNEVSLMPSLSNWEIKVSSNTIPELAKYALENMIDKLKS